MPSPTTLMADSPTPGRVASIPEVDWNAAVGFRRLFFGDPMDNLQRIAQAAGGLCRMNVLAQTIVLVNSAEFVQEALVTRSNSFTVRRANYTSEKSPGEPIQARTIMGSDGAPHRQHRKMIAPAFSPAHFAGFADAIVAAVQKVQADWPEGKPIAIASHLEDIAIEIIGKIVLGIDGMSRSPLGAAQKIVVRAGFDGGPSPAYLPLRWNLPSPRQTLLAVTDLENAVAGEIRARRETDLNQGDMLALILCAQQGEADGLTDDEVRDEILGILTAGTLLVGLSLAWLWTTLSQEPALYECLREETDRVLGGRTPRYDDLPQLVFSQQLFKEALRQMPRRSAIQRVALEDTELGGFPIPLGTVICIFPYLLHQNPSYFPEPDQFLPERFDLAHEKSLPKFAFMPFGGGRHLCLGNHFALMEGPLIIAALAQRVRLTLQRPRRANALSSLRPADDVLMQVSRVF